MKISQAVAYAVLGIAVSTVVLTSMLSSSSPATMWAIINQIQLLLLLLLTGAYFPKDVVDFLTGFEFSMLSLNFLQTDTWSIFDKVTNWLHSEQPHYYLGVIGVESKSSLVNLSSFLFNLLIQTSIH